MQGKRVGPYVVGDLIGRGGMGEVYRARDQRLDRDVAVKILPGELSADPERLARFEREAKVLAALQHQNIAAIFGIESHEGTPVLVMELAEGEDLSERLAAGALPGDEVQRIAGQIARGLEFAHDKGIVHRDLKPANVKVAADGRVKILDFGLARALTSDGPGSADSGDSFQPTLTQALTGAGTVLGTAAYMSPEQARGYPVDRRSDIWAFGVILFEMLTGRRLFEGATATDTLAAVLRKEPEWEDLPADVPPLLAQVCRRCLEKDPQQRLRDIGEVRIALDGGASTILDLSSQRLSPLPGGPFRKGVPGWAWGVMAVLALALGGVGFLGLTGRIGPAPAPDPLVRATVTMADGVQLGLNPAAPGPVKVSPDGRMLAFTGVDSLGQVAIHLRGLGDTLPRQVSSTLGAAYPFWSADSRSVAFFSGDGNLKRLDVAGGPITTICKAENGKGGDWNRFDEVIFAPSHVAAIHLVSATGGEPRPVTRLADQPDARSHRFPSWLPDGEHFLYLAVRRGGTADMAGAVLRIASKDGVLDRELMPIQAGGVYSEGHVLFVHDQILMARPFSLEALDFTGPAFPLLEDVMVIGAAHLAVFSVSGTGVLAMCTGTGGGMGTTTLQLLDPAGQEIRRIGQPVTTFGVSFDPPGRNVALVLADDQLGTFDIWIYEIERDLRTRLTFENETEYFPIWSPDGQWIYYAADNAQHTSIFRRRLAGGGGPELVLANGQDCTPTAISRDGSLLAYTAGDSGGDFSIGLIDLTGEREPWVFRNTEFFEGRASFSPDGKWLAYMSLETGNGEIFAESLEPGRGRYRVSSRGGNLAAWAPDGNAIYYLTDSGEMMAVEVAAEGDGLRFGRTTRIYEGVLTSIAMTMAIDPASGNILVQKSVQGDHATAMTLITGWGNLLERRRE
ncbi:MAG: protein kinase [bacterium]